MNPNPTTTVRHYSLVVQATAAEDKAREKWHEAYRAYEEANTLHNRAAMIAASIDYQAARAQADNARQLFKHAHFKRVSEGLNNTLSGSLDDAGFGQDGRL